jgi:hypothetical protein
MRAWWRELMETANALQVAAAMRTDRLLPACCAPHLHPACFTRNRKLNDWLGRIAITLYAYFDYDMLHKKVSCRGLPGCNSL